MYSAIYGEWDNNENQAAADKVTVRVTINEWLSERRGIFFAGRQIAGATGRDSGARLGHGVVLIEGKFSSGGTWKNFTTTAEPETIFELKDVPLSKVKDEMEDDSWVIEILNADEISKSKLIEERKRLQARLADIEELLTAGE